MGSRLCSMVKKLSWRSSCENKSIKLITVDGKVIRINRRVYVKEIVEEYPHHGIFDASSVKRLGTRVLTRPLDHNSELEPGHLYYLIPFSSSGSRIEVFKQIYSHPAIISASSIDNNHVVQVKLRMKKENVASFLDSTSINFGEKFVMKEPQILGMGQLCYKCGSGFTSQWKPALATIAELNNSQIGN